MPCSVSTSFSSIQTLNENAYINNGGDMRWVINYIKYEAKNNVNSSTGGNFSHFTEKVICITWVRDWILTNILTESEQE